MTALDKFEPRGEPMHPYDLLDFHDPHVVELEQSPVAEDEADYFRNMAKIGRNVIVDGKPVFLTTAVPWKTARCRRA